MDSLSKLHYHQHQPLSVSLDLHRSSFPNLISSLSFRTPPPPPPRFKSSCSASSHSSSASFHLPPQNPKPSLSETLSLFSSSILKTTCVTVAAATFFFMRFHHRPAIAAPVAVETVDSTKESTDEEASFEERARRIEEKLRADPDDLEALRLLMEVRIKAGKLPEAVEILDHLIELDPNDREWPLLKANIHSYMNKPELASSEFEEILAKDPLSIEAYHGLVMASEPDDNSLKGILARVEDALEKCKKQKSKSEVRDFKLLIAQIKVMEGSFSDALDVYQELVREEPRDFRPYLCQGIIYTLLKKNNEAEKHFEKFRKLVPKNHPYGEYFDDNMFATKLFSQKVERERAVSKS